MKVNFFAFLLVLFHVFISIYGDSTSEDRSRAVGRERSYASLRLNKGSKRYLILVDMFRSG